MGRQKRRTKWYDALISKRSVTGGAVDTDSIISEAQMDEFSGGGTIVRIVGQIQHLAVASDTDMNFTLMLQSALASVGPITLAEFAAAGTYERQGMLWTVKSCAAVEQGFVTIPVDVRAKRRLTPGMSLNLSASNHSANTANWAYHIRVLVMLH